MNSKDIQKHRAMLLKKQNGVCPLCETVVSEHEAVLDHCHDTGKVRAVLHRSCNGAEGRIKSWCKRSRSGDQVQFLLNLLMYIQADYSKNEEHPMHKRELQKQFNRKSKSEQIAELQERGVQVQGKMTKKDLLRLYKFSLG